MIWRPGGTPGGNVFTTWATVYAAIAAVQGEATLYIDSSIAPAIVPAGTWDGFGCAKIACYSQEASTDGYIFTIADGATLHNWWGLDGAVAVCQCQTAPSFSFDLYGAFTLKGLSSIVLDGSATVPAIQVPPGGGPGEFAIVSNLGGLDNSAAPSVPVVGVAVDGYANFYLSGFSFQHFPFLQTGNEIGGPVGSNVFYQHDNTEPPLTSTLFLGTLEDDRTSQVQWGGSGTPTPATAGQIPIADGAGGTSWGDAPYTATVPGNWAGAAPTRTQDALDRMAALLQTLNGGAPIP